MGLRYPPVVKSWEEVVELCERWGRAAESLIAKSILASSVRRELWGFVTLDKFVVGEMPRREPPFDCIVITVPRHDAVRIEHRTHTGHNDVIERPVADATRLFWRFVDEKWGIRSIDRPPHLTD
jgi:hypothetical protein